MTEELQASSEHEEDLVVVWLDKDIDDIEDTDLKTLLTDEHLNVGQFDGNIEVGVEMLRSFFDGLRIPTQRVLNHEERKRVKIGLVNTQDLGAAIYNVALGGILINKRVLEDFSKFDLNKIIKAYDLWGALAFHGPVSYLYRSIGIEEAAHISYYIKKPDFEAEILDKMERGEWSPAKSTKEHFAKPTERRALIWKLSDAKELGITTQIKVLEEQKRLGKPSSRSWMDRLKSITI